MFYLSDISSLLETITKYYRAIETRLVVPDDAWRFGYTGQHLILALPTEAVPKKINVSDAPEFFELQLKTLWQHAWSEANHDLGYKTAPELNEDQQRRLAFTAAQGWGADRVFDELVKEIYSSTSET
jgi:ppGpp synthetase/RelA/SpoT-type nucleotidyltranferase